MLALLLTTQILFASGGRGPALHLIRSEAQLPECPANALLEKAVRLRLPAVRLSSDRKLGPGDLIASLRRAGGADWRFEVTRPDGTIAMSRELRGMACPQIADTCALILERYLSGINWIGREVSPIRMPKAEPTPDQQAPPTPFIPGELEGPAEAPFIPSEVEAPESARPSTPLGVNGSGPENGNLPARPSSLDAPPVTALTLSIGGGVWGAVPLEAAAAFSGELGIRLFQRFHFSLLFLGTPSSLRTIVLNGETRGSLTVQAFAAFATASLCTTDEGFSACGGLLGGVRLTAVSVTTNTTLTRLFRTQSTLAPTPELGVYGKFSWPLYGRFCVAIDLGVGVPLGSARFDVEGIDAAGYVTPRVDLTGTLYLGFRLF